MKSSGLRERRQDPGQQHPGKDDASQEELLDMSEQAALVAELRHKGEKQSQSTRRLFQVIYAALLVAMLYCAAMMLVMPFVLEHQVRFKVSVSKSGFLFSYLLNICAIVSSIIILTGRRRTRLVALGFASGVANLLFWLGVFWLETPIPGVGYWWLPTLSLLVTGMSLYIDQDLRSLMGDIEGLEGLKYDYKKV